MLVVITNTTATDITLLGLPEKGLIPANDSATFKVCQEMLDGYAGLRSELGSTLQRLAGLGTITYVVYPEAGDMSPRTFRASRTLSFDDADIDIAAVSAAVNLTVGGLPLNARVTSLVADTTTKWIGGGASTCVLNVGWTAADPDDLIDNQDIFAAAAVDYGVFRPANVFPATEGQHLVAKVTGDVNLAGFTQGVTVIEATYVLV